MANLLIALQNLYLLNLGFYNYGGQIRIENPKKQGGFSIVFLYSARLFLASITKLVYEKKIIIPEEEEAVPVEAPVEAPAASSVALAPAAPAASSPLTDNLITIPYEMYDACGDGPIERVKEIFNKYERNGTKIDLNTREFGDPWTALHYACNFNHLDIAELLVSKGADVNIPSTKNPNWFPIQYACREGYKGIVEFLLNNGAELEPRTNNTHPPLYVACSNNQLEVAKFLVDRGADVNAIYYFDGDFVENEFRDTAKKAEFIEYVKIHGSSEQKRRFVVAKPLSKKTEPAPVPVESSDEGPKELQLEDLEDTPPSPQQSYDEGDGTWKYTTEAETSLKKENPLNMGDPARLSSKGGKRRRTKKANKRNKNPVYKSKRRRQTKTKR
jgi:hypothetical protein